MPHSINIPDWIWQYEQERTGMKNPASAIRDRLAKVIAEEKMASSNLLPSINELDFKGIEDDYPTSIPLKRPGVCDGCRKLMQVGETAFYFTKGNRKVITHPECWAGAADAENNF